MAIKKFNDYSATQAYSDYEPLPKGGYVIKIMDAEVCENSKGQYAKLSCDIAEGDYKDYYANDWRNQQREDKKWHCNYLLIVPKDDGTEKDGWTKRKFKTVIEAIEDSNPGYHFDWDEKKFKGKIAGGLFNLREYEKSNGETAWATNLAQICTAEKIRSGKFTIPKDKGLNGYSTPPSTSETTNEWMTVPNTDADDLPFD